MKILEAEDKMGKWELYDAPKHGLVAYHFCVSNRKIKASSPQNSFEKWVQVRIPKEPVRDSHSGRIYCQSCYNTIPDDLNAAMQLSGSVERLQERPFGGWWDYDKRPDLHQDHNWGWMMKI